MPPVAKAPVVALPDGRWMLVDSQLNALRSVSNPLDVKRFASAEDLDDYLDVCRPVDVHKTPRIVRLLGVDCRLVFDRYANNDTVAVQAIVCDPTHPDDGQPFCTVTVNYESCWQGAAPYAKAFAFPAVVVKNYSENEGIVRDLVQAGVVNRGGYLAGSGGTVEACVLTEFWQYVAQSSVK